MKPRKASTVVSSPVRERRATLMNKIRMDVSGGSVEDEIKQQSTEIKKGTNRNGQNDLRQQATTSLSCHEQRP